jgi:fatty acid desaturase
MSSYPPFYAYPSAPPVVRAVPNPPRLHWALLLVLSAVTLGIFGQAWMIVQSVWVSKVYGRSKALPWAITYTAVLPAFFLLMIALGVCGALMHLANVQQIAAIMLLFVRIILFILYVTTCFTLRGELSDYPISIPLSGFMTFFFGPIYFQYHLYDYEVSDEVHQFRGPLRTELETTAPISTPAI